MEQNNMDRSLIARHAAAAAKAADSVNAAQLLSKPKIGPEELRRANEILKKYKQGKAHLEQRIIDNEP